TSRFPRTSGLRMALIGPNLPPEQSAGHLTMTVNGNRLNDNAHAFIIDSGFSFRVSPTDFNGSFTGQFGGNEATSSLTAKELVTFTRNNAAETLPESMAAWKYLRGLQTLLRAGAPRLPPAHRLELAQCLYRSCQRNAHEHAPARHPSRRQAL